MTFGWRMLAGTGLLIFWLAIDLRNQVNAATWSSTYTIMYEIRNDTVPEKMVWKRFRMLLCGSRSVSVKDSAS